MRKIVIITVALFVLASGATYARYGNFDPCDWAAQDQAEVSSLPRLVWQGRLKAKLLLDGISEPAFSDCLLAWWESRADEARDEVSNQ